MDRVCWCGSYESQHTLADANSPMATSTMQPVDRQVVSLKDTAIDIQSIWPGITVSPAYVVHFPEYKWESKEAFEKFKKQETIARLMEDYKATYPWFFRQRRKLLRQIKELQKQ